MKSVKLLLEIMPAEICAGFSKSLKYFTELYPLETGVDNAINVNTSYDVYSADWDLCTLLYSVSH